jgi:hypothetical protein
LSVMADFANCGFSSLGSFSGWKIAEGLNDP